MKLDLSSIFKLVMLPKPILVSDEKIEEDDWYLWENRIIKNHLVPTTEGDFRSNHFHKSKLKIIAGIPELPRLDLSAVNAGTVQDLAKANGFDWENTESSARRVFEKWHQCNKYTEEDMIEFLEWVGKKGYPCIDASKKGLWVLNPLDPKDYTVKELLDSWLKERQPKVYNVEVEMECVGWETSTDAIIKVSKILCPK